ncbi:MAG: hypothetical protein ACTHOH_09150 [Lysobacteraceae bacterium]
MNVPMLLRALGAAALALALVLGLRAAIFVSKATHADGTVEQVAGRNDRCTRSNGSGKHHTTKRYDCTRFTATVRFAYAGRDHRVVLEAGKRKGHDASPAQVGLHAGEHVPMTFDPDHPDDAFRGGSGSLRVWGPSLLALLVGGVLVFVSFVRVVRTR